MITPPPLEVAVNSKVPDVQNNVSKNGLSGKLRANRSAGVMTKGQPGTRRNGHEHPVGSPNAEQQIQGVTQPASAAPPKYQSHWTRR